MVNQRITMRKIREVLRLHFAAQLSVRKISASTKISVGGIQKLLTKAKNLSLSWPLPDKFDDAQLAKLFYSRADTRQSQRFEVPDWSVVHKELKGKGVTKNLLWEEYTQQYPNRCYSYSQFWDRFMNWLKKQKRSMRQINKAAGQRQELPEFLCIITKVQNEKLPWLQKDLENLNTNLRSRIITSLDNIPLSSSFRSD